MIISKNNEFYDYATSIDTLKSVCRYIILQVLVRKWHFDYILHTARLDNRVYRGNKRCRWGKEVPSLLARVVLFLWSYCLLCSDIVYAINVAINNILRYFSFKHTSDLILLLEMFHVHSPCTSNMKSIKGNI